LTGRLEFTVTVGIIKNKSETNSNIFRYS